jgi:hypothetical protein
LRIFGWTLNIPSLPSSTKLAKASTALCDVKIMPPKAASFVRDILFSRRSVLTRPSSTSRKWCLKTGTKEGAKRRDEALWLGKELEICIVGTGLGFKEENWLGRRHVGRLCYNIRNSGLLRVVASWGVQDASCHFSGGGGVLDIMVID